MPAKHAERSRDVVRRRSLRRWPFPEDVQQVLGSWGVDGGQLRRQAPVLKAGSADDVHRRLRFLTEQLGKRASDLQEHPQFLWSRFEGHILPRSLYALQLGMLADLRLRELLGTRDTHLRDSRAWPAVCGSSARRSEYEALFAAVQRFAATRPPSTLLQSCLTDGLPEILASVRPVHDSREADGSMSTRRGLVSCMLPLCLGLLLGAKKALARNVRIEDVPDPALQKALFLVQEGRIADAEGAFSEIIAKQPDYASAWSNRGQTRMELGRYAEASADFGQAISLAPKAPVLYTNRANALLRLYDRGPEQQLLEDARTDCLTAAQLDPSEETAYYNLGEAWRRDALRSDHGSSEFKWRQAAEAYREACNAAPGFAAFQLKRGMALFEAGEEAEARQLLGRLVRKYPYYTEAANASAALLAAAGDAPGARAMLARAARYDEAQAGAQERPREYAAGRGWTPSLARAFVSLCEQQRGVLPL